MLDTIAINLQRDAFTIHEPDRFTPSADFLIRAKASKSIMYCHYNPGTKEKQKYGYMPRVTLYRKPAGYMAISLKIEFSAPKLVHGNNFEELNDQSLSRVVNALVLALKRMGIETTRRAIMNAKVTEIHYSKNILLDRFTPCHMIIRMLEKADMSSRMDLSQSDFRNGGQMAKYHTSTYEIAIYDKAKDLEQARKYGDKRGAEKDYWCQYDLFLNKEAPEVLRIEVRLKSKKTKRLFAKLGLQYEPDLKRMFCADTSRTILQYYWDEIKSGLYIMNIQAADLDKLIFNIQRHFPKKRPTSVCSLLGFVLACQQMGVRGAKLALRLNNSQFYRLRSDVRKLEQDHQCPHFRALGQIKKQLERFSPLTREDVLCE